MAGLGYQDFDLSIDRIGDSYRAKVIESPVGQAENTFEFPFEPLELENFFLRIGQPRRTVRRMGSDEGRAAESFGSKLYDSVLGGDVGIALLRSIDAADANGEGLRIRLNVGENPELADLPWEYLYSRNLGRFVVLSNHTPIVRHLDLSGTVRPLEIELPIRVLVIVSSPTDYDQLDVGREQAKLEESLAGLVERGMIEVEFTEDATVKSLQRKLRGSTAYHILHFIGHGGFDDATDEGVVLFEDEHERGRKLTGRKLGTFLHDHRSLRLVILNACEGARTAKEDPFGGVAQALLHNRIPAVVAMQFEITDEAAITFADAFYAAISEGIPVDGSVAAARKAILASDNDVEWATPVLYLRSADGRIFDIPDTPPVPRAVAAVVTTPDAEDGPDGDGPPGGSSAPIPLVDPEIEVAYRTAVDLRTAGDLERAAASFRQVLELDPDHAEAAEQLSAVTIDLSAAELYGDAADLIERGEIDAGQSKLQELAEMRPNYGDPDRLVDRIRQARAAEEAEERQRRFETLKTGLPTEPDEPKRGLGTAAKVGIGAVGAVIVLAIVGSLLPDDTVDPPATTTVTAPDVTGATATTAQQQASTTIIETTGLLDSLGLAPADSEQIVANFGTPFLDGDLIEWAGWPVFGSPHVVATNDWDGSEDHAVAWRVSYDDTAIYFGVVVEDELLVQQEIGASAFRGDSVNIDLRFDPTTSGGAPLLDAFQVIASPGDFAGTPPSITLFQGNGSIYEPVAPQPSGEFMQVVVNQVAGGYTLEIGLGWAIFGGFQPTDGMGFRLSANDNDLPGESVQQVMYSNVADSNLFDTRTYGTVLFR